MQNDGGFFGKIVDLNLIPYGASSGSGASIQCQHGEEECMLNKVTGCTLKHLTDPAQVLPYILCVDREADAGQTNPSTVISQCVPEALQTSATTCFNTEIDAVMTDVANRHAQLHASYCPWVDVNGQHLDYKYSVMLTVCATYQGADKPEACGQAPAANSLAAAVLNETVHRANASHHAAQNGTMLVRAISDGNTRAAQEFEAMLCRVDDADAVGKHGSNYTVFSPVG
jgi:interferon gamma-inducible protein 30